MCHLDNLYEIYNQCYPTHPIYPCGTYKIYNSWFGTYLNIKSGFNPGETYGTKFESNKGFSFNNWLDVNGSITADSITLDTQNYSVNLGPSGTHRGRLGAWGSQH